MVNCSEAAGWRHWNFNLRQNQGWCCSNSQDYLVPYNTGDRYSKSFLWWKVAVSGLSVIPYHGEQLSDFIVIMADYNILLRRISVMFHRSAYPKLTCGSSNLVFDHEKLTLPSGVANPLVSPLTAVSFVSKTANGSKSLNLRQTPTQLSIPSNVRDQNATKGTLENYAWVTGSCSQESAMWLVRKPTS